ncbi:MAG TPA: tRNA uridine(34) 5-carboxymethylaminomethyl modification radical SAM/GNAT enzyme Elp3 [Promineifilum sp.]|nr:tRNA uridine(34) 5-carboxymethylaminomethyl modification radical SAM/GNAT enzyme Elp3 [Promineifilum sp.]HRO91633.1 tRNA uridine(34) 5-carboxymethylaminomethyl modification radical SAM/GNAT enzyme Elp3 [Promineifilum sp.]HRQ12002.1 tRNA uridine(34) 5-carboxymethylaminomethyl modification radical SAM/GNAT enzyme Elp3 [Promineifilum sp.]
MQNEISVREAEWLDRNQPIDVAGREALLIELIHALVALRPLTGKRYNRTMQTFARRGLPWLSKGQVLAAYEQLCTDGRLEFDPDVRAHLQMKPMRTQSGVSVVTVLTKPYPCPGQCIFCPTDVRMPKSYLHDEPGAQRAERHHFDPYAQTASRLRALERIGHPTEKIELLILGGTWSSYRRDYQEWFVKRCFDALNGFEAASLAEAQTANATAQRRNVGLVVETRQDRVDIDELRWFRTLGVTKVQVGIQTLDERVLTLNKRGHDVQSTRDAFRLLRLAGFKIHGHWMANLLGATVASDIEDFGRLWSDPAIRPDELKLYPCMLLPNAELHDYWLRGEYTPYTEEEVVEVLAECKAQVPRYVRLNRVVRDFPTTNVVAGNKKANLRQIAQEKLREEDRPCRCIRCREIRRDAIYFEDLELRDLVYQTDATTEHFLSYETTAGFPHEDRLAGFLRLSLPDPGIDHPLPELIGHAMIREVHVYGPALNLGDDSRGEAQHIGLGTRLIERAKAIARAGGYRHMAVISAIGTREYYARLGFELNGLYMTCALD